MKHRMKKQVKGKGRKCTSCGASSHQRSSHSKCPFYQGNGASAGSKNTDPVFPECDEDISQSVVTSATSSEIDREIDEISFCTCEAEGRAHRRDCPVSSRKRYPSRALFPCLNSAESCAVVAISEGDLETAVVAHTSDKKTVDMIVGAYVCLYSRRLGKYHLPCRIVKAFGKRCQLYCSKGVLNNSYSGTELMPLTGNDSIPLDKWRQAPKVSLSSIGSDLAVVKPCDCNIPSFTESILIPSSSEADDTGHDVWVNNTLTHQDRKIIVSRSGWLTDKVITAAQMLMLQYFPGMSGLQPPTLQEVCAFQVHTKEFVQIVNIRNKHWCVVSSVGCVSGVVNVYDSLCSSVSNKMIHLIASMVYSSSSTLEVRTMDVAKQSNSSDCGVLSIAYAFDLCSGYDPCEVKYDHKKIRQHLVSCLENCQLSRLPLLLCEQKSSSTKFEKTVRMPGESHDMAKCDICHVWYHRHCMDIPSEVFDKEEDIYWECKACCAKDTS